MPRPSSGLTSIEPPLMSDRETVILPQRLDEFANLTMAVKLQERALPHASHAAARSPGSRPQFQHSLGRHNSLRCPARAPPSHKPQCTRQRQRRGTRHAGQSIAAATSSQFSRPNRSIAWVSSAWVCTTSIAITGSPYRSSTRSGRMPPSSGSSRQTWSKVGSRSEILIPQPRQGTRALCIWADCNAAASVSQAFRCRADSPREQVLA